MKFFAHIPFVETLGLELISMGGGEAELACEVSEALCNSWGVAHGGLVMTLLDVAMAHAAKSGRDDADPGGVATVEMKTSFMRPGTGRLTAKARVITQTASLSFCEGTVCSAQGEVLAHATGTFKVLRAAASGS